MVLMSHKTIQHVEVYNCTRQRSGTIEYLTSCPLGVFRRYLPDSDANQWESGGDSIQKHPGPRGGRPGGGCREQSIHKKGEF